MKPAAARGTWTVHRLTPARIEDLGQVLRGSWGNGCWCIFPRMTPVMERDLGGEGSAADRRRREMTRLARRRIAPGLLAYEGDQPVGWIAIAPRSELARVDRSRATPPVDDVPVWVIPCITVRKNARGQGIALELIHAAVEYAASRGAPAVEAYVRAGKDRVQDDFAYYGTESLFRRAGFKVVRKLIRGLPKNWTPRVTMRMACGSKASFG